MRPTGTEAVRSGLLGKYGLNTELLTERLDFVRTDNITWQGRLPTDIVGMHPNFLVVGYSISVLGCFRKCCPVVANFFGPLALLSE